MGRFIDATLRLIDNFTSPMNNAVSSLERNARNIQRQGKQIEAAGKGIAGMGSSLTKAVTVPIAGIGTMAIKTAADFEAAMDNVQAIAGVTTEEMGLLSEKAKEMGAKTKFSATEAADAFSYMAMAGWKTTDMMNGIEGIMYLAGATGEELAMTSDIVTDALTAFGMTAADTNRFVDVLAKASSNANTNVSLMGETFKYVAPSAGALGYSVEDTAVAIGLMANSGIKASQAGTSLNSLLTRMAKPTKESRTAMEALGISLTDSEGNMKSFATVMADMRKGFSGLTETQKAQYAAMLAGKTGMSGLLGIVNATQSDFDKLTQSIANSTGAAEEMYNVANDNLSGRLTILKSTLESIAITMGEKLMPFVEKGVGKLQELADKFGTLDDATLNTIIKVAAVAAAVGPAILIFGKMVIGVGKVVTIIGNLGIAISRAGGVMALLTSPAGIVIGVLAAIVAATVLVIKNFDKIKPVLIQVKSWFVSTFGESIRKAIEGFKKVVAAIAPVVESAFNMAGRAVIAIIKAIASATKRLTPAFKLIGNAAKTIATLIGGALKKGFENLGKIIEWLAPYVKQIARIIGDFLGFAIEKTAPIISKLSSAFREMAMSVAVRVSGFVDVVKSIWTVVEPVISKVAGIIKDVFGPVVEATIQNAIVCFRGFIDTAKEVFSGVTTTLGGIIDFLSGVFTGNWDKAWNGIKDIFKGVFESIGAVAKTALNGVISIVNSAISGINKLGITIPDWMPGGGKTFKIDVPKIPMLYTGTTNWKGGPAVIHDRGAEIVDLPSGTRVYPHDKSLEMARAEGTKTTSISIAKLADTIVVREEADINKIANAIVQKIEKTACNMA